MGNSGSVQNLDVAGGAYGSNGYQPYYQPQQQPCDNKRHQGHLLYKYADDALLRRHRQQLQEQQLQQQQQQQQQRQQQQQPQHHRQLYASPQDWTTKSLPHMSAMSCVSAAQLQQQCKVLPQLNERDRLKLRATTNGCILNAGGTISGRKEITKQQSESSNNSSATQTTPALPGQLQRARTVIEMEPHTCAGQAPSPPLVLRRSQTLLQLHVQNKAALLSKRNSWGATAVSATVAASTPSLAKVSNGTAANAQKCYNSNKYQKKRKAPAAPSASTKNECSVGTVAKMKMQQQGVTANGNGANSAAATAPKPISVRELQPRARLFRTHMKTVHQPQHQEPPQKQQQLEQQQQQHHHHHQLLRKSTSHNNTVVAQSQDLVKPGGTDGLAAGLSCAALLPAATGSAVRLPFRREKSSDAILYRAVGNGAEIATNDNGNVRNEAERAVSNGPAKLNHLQAVATATAAITTIPIEAATSTVATGVPVNKRKTSKIPQLKQTFYFGMRTISPSKTTSQAHQLPQQQQKASTNEYKGITELPAKASEQQQLLPLHQSPTEIEEILDNGLLVQVRPMLPRRQLETPNFSPTAAWRMLFEEKQRIQAERQRQSACVASFKPLELVKQQANPNERVLCEQPIQLSSIVLSQGRITQHKQQRCDGAEGSKQPSERKEPPQRKMQQQQQHMQAWTPQQDLDDEDEEEDEIAHTHSHHADHVDAKICDNAPILRQMQATATSGSQNSGTERQYAGQRKSKERSPLGGSPSTLHVFNLSLPRGSYRDLHMKSLVEFNSLQKLRHTTTATAIAATTRTIAGKVHMDAASNTSINYCSDNWMLHKNKTARRGAVAHEAPIEATDSSTSNNNALNTATAAYSGATINWSALPARIEPLSLTYLTTGKYVMYLPEAADSGPANNTACKVIAGNSPGQMRRQRKNSPTKSSQSHAPRESLQDEPDQTTATSAVLRTKTSAALQDKSQRFSFQSTIRLLEKRRLAERLAKEAEIQEARRLSELEAMKRVEEDFQRKRASEKANIRNQLLRYFADGADMLAAGNNDVHEAYQSLPTRVDMDKPDSNNNNIGYRRTDPEGAVTATSPLQWEKQLATEGTRVLNGGGNSSSNNNNNNNNSNRTRLSASQPTMQRYDSDCGESNMDANDNAEENVDDDADDLIATPAADMHLLHSFTRTASLIEPYLKSIKK